MTLSNCGQRGREPGSSHTSVAGHAQQVSKASPAPAGVKRPRPPGAPRVPVEKTRPDLPVGCVGPTPEAEPGARDSSSPGGDPRDRPGPVRAAPRHVEGSSPVPQRLRPTTSPWSPRVADALRALARLGPPPPPPSLQGTGCRMCFRGRDLVPEEKKHTTWWPWWQWHSSKRLWTWAWLWTVYPK